MKQVSVAKIEKTNPSAFAYYKKVLGEDLETSVEVLPFYAI